MDDKMPKKLSTKQKLLAELMALEPDWTNADYAKEIGIDQKTLYRWKKEEIFKDYLHQICREKFKDLERLAIKKLADQIRGGNFYAITYVLDSTGYKAAEHLDINAKGITLNVGIVED